MEEEDDDIKVNLVGEMGTGKTSLINTAIGLEFQEKVPTTNSNSIMNKIIEIDGQSYSINLWDTIGQEKYRSLTNIFLNGAQIVIFVFDITSKGSFEQLDYWFDIIEREVGKDIIKGIAANKIDLFENQKVEEDLIEEYSKNKGMKYSYTTATDIKGFSDFLQNLIKDYLKQNKDESRSNKGQKLDDITIDNQAHSKCC